MRANPWLIAGGMLSGAAAALHVAIILGGSGWYRFFGAGERMARAAEHGSPRPALITAAIAAVLAIWACYAFSGAGIIRRLPLLRTALLLISTIYLARALVPLALLIIHPVPLDPFIWWSSAVVLVYGLAYAIGTATAWPRLRGR